MKHKKQTHSYPNEPLWFVCPECSKRTYGSRKEAKVIARRMQGDMRAQAYRCLSGHGWHTGHLAPAVVYGFKTRRELYGMAMAA